MTADALRELLFDAKGDELGALCKLHRAAILENFSAWQKVPEAIRNDPARLPRYGQGLIGVAQCFAQLGDPSLMQRLTGGKNPLTEWQAGLQTARTQLDEGQYAEAVVALEKMLETASRLRGPGVDQLLPYTLEFLGEARFHSGQVERAREPFERALALSSDEQGRLACLNSLYEVNRYLGEFARADHYAAQLPKEMRHFAAAEDEPLLRVVVQIGDRRHELDEAPPPTGRVQFLFQRNRLTLRGADARTNAGEKLASAGHYPEALACFTEAAAIDAFDPRCRYLSALTLLHLRRHPEAAKQYRDVERLAPGWYHSRHDAWLADQLTCGNLPQEALLAHLQLEDGNHPADEILRLADASVRWPLPSAHLYRGRALSQTGRKDEAAAAFRRGLELAGDADIRARLSLELWLLTKEPALLEAAQDPAGNPVAAAQARFISRHQPT